MPCVSLHTVRPAYWKWRNAYFKIGYESMTRKASGCKLQTQKCSPHSYLHRKADIKQMTLIHIHCLATLMKL